MSIVKSFQRLEADFHSTQKNMATHMTRKKIIRRNKGNKQNFGGGMDRMSDRAIRRTK